MIVCKLQGGIGNQMFQYASALSIAKRNECDVEFVWEMLENNTQRPFKLDEFPNIEVKMLKEFYNGFLTVSDNFKYSEIITHGRDIFLNGYWQSEKYFKDNEKLIRNTFEINESINYTVPDKSVSLHIRRGDYLNSNGYHPVQTIEYYKKAIDKVGDYDKLFILSDDITWCKENVIFDNVVFVEGQNEIQDLKVMSLCDHNIIANSSFSWWGAWLNDNPNKIVICPCNWLGNNVNLNTSDIIPEGWLKV
tara:strand:+ start:1266 stop:2012 length:747 start_codon:yes stop_codon:yes gene_type:complete